MANRIGSIILEGATTVEDTILIGNDEGRSVAEGTLQDMDVENRNKRIYAKADLMPEINGPRMKELIAAKQFFGECGHPLTDDLARQQTIDPKNKCVRYDKIWVDGNKVKAWYIGTYNELGNTFDKELKTGGKPAFSLRALGSIENVNGKAYVKDIKIITWDHVVYPSHKAAYTEKLLTESANMTDNNGIVVPENDPGTIIKLTGANAQKLMNTLKRESANINATMQSSQGLFDTITLVRENTLCLSNRFGDKAYIDIESHIDDIITNYAYRQ